MRTIRFHNRKGMADPWLLLTLCIGFGTALIAMGMILPIGQQLIHSTSSSVDPDDTWTDIENNTLTSISTNTQTAYSLFANAPLLAGAGGIIGLIAVAFGAIAGRGGGL